MSTSADIVTPVPGIEYLTYEDANILLNLQRLWMEIVHWTRIFFNSVAEKLPDESAVGTRLFLKLPTDIYNEFKKYFSESESRQFMNIISRLIAGNWQLINAYNNNDKTAIDLSTIQWYRTADELAAFLAQISKYVDETQLKNLLHDYIDLKIKEIVAIIYHNYDEEIKLYDEIEEKAIHIASHMARAVIAMRHASQAKPQSINKYKEPQ